ncbi:MAG: hypothetical protein F4Y44_11210 [Chloroflexi bacterium]|nr:hypothetical protein [Chloroflexota bacterium]
MLQKRNLLVLASVCVVLMLGVIACGQPVPEPPPPTTAPRMSPPPPPPAPTVAVASGQNGTGQAGGGGTPVDVGLLDIGGSGEYAYSPADMTFSVGETVTFTMTAETEFHTFEVDDLDIYVEVDAGDTVDFTFTFDEAGTYELICTPHSAQGMVGTITIN